VKTSKHILFCITMSQWKKSLLRFPSVIVAAFTLFMMFYQFLNVTSLSQSPFLTTPNMRCSIFNHTFSSREHYTHTSISLLATQIECPIWLTNHNHGSIHVFPFQPSTQFRAWNFFHTQLLSLNVEETN
jgi:hypothetical protein